MDNSDKTFYEQLKSDACSKGTILCVPDDELISLVLSRCDVLKYPKNFRLINEGDVIDALYILKSGVTRVSYYEEDKEKTLGIGSESTISISPLGFVSGSPAHYMITACTNVEVYRLNKEDFDSLMMEYPAFSRWMLGIALAQMAMFEFKSQNLVGSSKDKYKSLRSREYIEKWRSFVKSPVPEINREVSDRVIASYLGVHPAYLSTIKRELIEEERNKKPRDQ